MIVDESERQYFTAYFDHVCNDAELLKKIESTPGSQEFSVIISKGWLGWLDEKRLCTTY